MPDLTQLKQMSARFAPVKIKHDVSKLSSGDRKALARLIEAAKVLNHVFMDQLWSGNRDLYEKLQKDTTPLGKQRLHYFWLNKGPWSDLDGHTAFLPDVPARKPEGANFCLTDIFPWKDELSAGIDHEAFCLSFLRQPDLDCCRTTPGLLKEFRTADKLLDEGDMAGAEAWRLQAKAPAEGEKVH